MHFSLDVQCMLLAMFDTTIVNTHSRIENFGHKHSFEDGGGMKDAHLKRANESLSDGSQSIFFGTDSLR